MSHFTVLVVHPTQLDDEVLGRLLAPYHEFECTGQDDEYVIDVDQTEDARSEYLSGTERRYKDPEGVLYDPYLDQFYRDPTLDEEKKIGPTFGVTGFGEGVSYTSRDWSDGKGYRAKVHFLPDGWSEIDIPRSETETFAKFVEDYYGRKTIVIGQEPDLNKDHKYGYAVVDEKGEVVKVINRTNPNAEWDWWSVGGRWSGFFKLKNISESLNRGQLGRPGAFGPHDVPEGRADVCQLRDLDLDGMRNEAATKALVEFDKAHAVIAGRELPDDVAIRAECGEDHELFREKFWQHPVLLDLNKNDMRFWSIDEVSKLRRTREQVEADARAGAISTFAVLKDGNWHQRGKMGWWGMVSDEKDSDQWTREFGAMLDGLPPETWVALIDCHI